MKTSSLLYATLVASTAWATDSNAFMVKYEGVLERLSALQPSLSRDARNLLAHKVPHADPVWFEVEGGFPTSKMTSKLGIPDLINGTLSLGADTPKTNFAVDELDKITNIKFQSCDIYHSETRVLMYGGTTVRTSDCKDVDVYIVTDYPKAEDSPEDKNLRVPNLPKTDYIFFVEDGGFFEALSAFRLRGDDKDKFVLAQLSGLSRPVGFKFDVTFSTTEVKPMQGNSGLAKGMLYVGGQAPNTSLTLDNKNRILT